MYKDLPEEHKKILNSEQKAIIDSNERNIIVSASPGCGKTYTLVKKIEREFASQSDKLGIIACSFTREAAKQLENKLANTVDLSLSFVGTIDAFVLTGIIFPYKNRCIKHLLQSEIFPDDFVITMPGPRTKSNEITKVGKKHLEVESYYRSWCNQFMQGTYEISYCSYLLAIDMIKNMPEVKNYLSARFTGIYIDEAQDLNEFQHDFIRTLKNDCGLKTFLIGDKNQSIYEFRGARPAFFSALPEEGYVNYPISISVRCHKSIMDFSNCFLDSSYVPTPNNEVRVSVYEKTDAKVLETILFSSDSVLWLCDTNELAKIFFDYSLSKNLGFKYTKPIEINDEDFKGTYLNLLEEILRFYYNYKNPVASFAYSIENIETVLSDYILEKSLKALRLILINTNQKPDIYLKLVFEKIGISIPSSVLDDIKDQLTDSICFEHYVKTEDKKRIMTIHGAKGLEAKCVIIFVDYDNWTYNNRQEDKESRYRAYYVGFSRAEEELHIFFRKDKIVKHGNSLPIIQTIVRDIIKTSYDKVSELS